MISIRQISFDLTKYLAGELKLGQKESETIRYGFEIILGSILKGLVIMGLAYLMGIFPLVLVSLATSGMYKLLSGGAHCNTFGRCLVFSTITLLGIGEIALFLSPHIDFKELVFLALASTLTGLYVVKKWAPVDTPNKPITKKEKKERYRQLSFLYILAWGLGSTLFIIHIQTRGPFPFALALASIGGFLAQTFSLTPMGINLIELADKGLGKLVP